jgi:hypothetical protein
MYVLLMTFSEDAQAQAALATLGTAGIGPISVIPGVGFNGDGRRRQCLHAFCFMDDGASVETVRSLLAQTVGPPTGPFARWAILPAVNAYPAGLAAARAERA